MSLNSISDLQDMVDEMDYGDGEGSLYFGLCQLCGVDDSLDAHVIVGHESTTLHLCDPCGDMIT